MFIKKSLGFLLLLFWLSPSLAWELNQKTRKLDQQHLRLELFFDLEKKQVRGIAHLKFTLIQPTQTVQVHGKDLVIFAVKDGKERDLPYRYDGKILTLHLSSRILPLGRKFEVAIRYAASPKRGLYFFKPSPLSPNIPYQVWSQGEGTDNRNWFPCYDEPDDRLTSELIAYVPAGFSVISNGVLLEKKPLSLEAIQKRISGLESPKKFKKFERWHFIQKRSHVTYLISVIVGDFERVQEQHRKVLLSYYVPPGWKKWAHLSFSLTPKMMAFFEKFTGQLYPWPKYDQTTVWDFIYGGMENTGATTLNMRTLHDQRAHLDYRSDYLVAHELAHQWFGDLITCRDWDHIWLNEGFATYFTNLWVEHHRGRGEFLLSMGQNNQGYVRGSERENWSRFKRKEKTPIDLAFAGRAYTRGAAILNHLRFVLGPEVFKKGIQHYVRQNRDECKTSEDFRRAMEEASGQDLSWFFHQWVYGAGYPEFTVKYSWSEETREASLTVEQTQKVTPGRGIFQVPLLIELRGPGYRVQRRVFLTGREHTFTYLLPSAPRMVRFNKEGWAPCKVNFTKDFSLWEVQAREDDDPTGRWQALKELSSFGEKALPVLSRAMAREILSELREEALETLKRIKSPKTLPLILEGLKDGDSGVRQKAVEALERFGDQKKKLGPLLIALIQKDPSYYVRAKACRALGKLKVSGAFEILSGAVKMKSHHNVIQEHVFYGLEALGDKRALPILFQYAGYSHGQGGLHRNRQAALDVLCRMAPRDPLTKKALLLGLEDPFHRMRAKAAYWVSKLAIKEALPLLARMKDDPHPGPRHGAQRAIDAMTKKPKKNPAPVLSSKGASQKIAHLQKELAKKSREVERLKLEALLGAEGEKKNRLEKGLQALIKSGKGKKNHQKEIQNFQLQIGERELRIIEIKIKILKLLLKEKKKNQ